MEQIFTILGWVASIILGVLGFLAIIVFKQNAQISVLQKTVDTLVTRLDLFLKEEKDAFKEIVTQNTQALKDLAK